MLRGALLILTRPAADVVFHSYMSPEAHRTLLPLLEDAMPLGGRIITCAFPLLQEFIHKLPVDQQNDKCVSVRGADVAATVL